MIIAIDFDGTCVSHEYPEIGKDINAIPVLKELVGKGHKLILWTMRGGKCLLAAEQWFIDNNIPLYGVNTNPSQAEWTLSPKAYAQLYIDDAALGAPLITTTYDARPFVDWSEVRRILTKSGVL